MAKKLKTGDVKRFKRAECPQVLDGDKWATISSENLSKLSKVWSWRKRDLARAGARFYGERIARILSIGPKYVTVRISK